MRSIAGAGIGVQAPASFAGAGVRSEVLQHADMASLTAAFAALVAELVAEQGSEWQLSFYDLAGSGDGNVFTLVTWWINEAAQDVSGSGIPASDILTIASQAAQSEALTLTDLASRGTIPNGDWLLVQSDFAGNSHGTRFGNSYLLQPPSPG